MADLGCLEVAPPLPEYFSLCEHDSQFTAKKAAFPFDEVGLQTLEKAKKSSQLRQTAQTQRENCVCT